MLTSIFKTLRFLLVVGLVLYLGQIPANGRTVGEHFSLWVKEIFKKTNVKLSKSSLVASLPRYFNQNKDERRVTNDPDKKANDANGISTSDRESLLRVLQ